MIGILLHFFASEAGVSRLSVPSLFTLLCCFRRSRLVPGLRGRAIKDVSPSFSRHNICAYGLSCRSSEALRLIYSLSDTRALLQPTSSSRPRSCFAVMTMAEKLLDCTSPLSCGTAYTEVMCTGRKSAISLFLHSFLLVHSLLESELAVIESI